MASLAATGFPKTPTPSSKIPGKSHRYPQFTCLKLHRLTSQRPIFLKTAIRASNPSAAAKSSSPGFYSAKQYQLTVPNVDLVLEDVRPYLIADGGNVDVVSVEDGVVSLKLQGACGSCPSSTTTMKMGIERVLKEKFGDALKDIQQVFDEENKEITVEALRARDCESEIRASYGDEGKQFTSCGIGVLDDWGCYGLVHYSLTENRRQAVNRHLDILRPAIKNFGGSVEVLSVEGGDCHVNYVGPESIGSGIKAAIKEKFPDIGNVVFTG